jgi:hypothetical protein
MALTEEQSEQLAELESARGMLVETYWPRLSDDAIWRLGQWAEKIQDKAGALATWLHGQVVQEIYRRASEKPIDVKACRVPVNWDNNQLADALVAVFAILQSNGLRELDDFLDKLSLIIAVQAASRLRGENNA